MKHRLVSLRINLGIDLVADCPSVQDALKAVAAAKVHQDVLTALLKNDFGLRVLITEVDEKFQIESAELLERAK